MVYCGLNSLDGDLLYRFDPVKETFECLGTKQWSNEFDVKIHRTILRNPIDHSLYFGTSLLHDLDRQLCARGGKLVRYNPRSGSYQIVGVPAPLLYLQSIAADWQRNLIYSFTYPAEALYKTDLTTRQSSLVGYLGNAILFAQPHNAVVDRHGWLWGTCAETRAWDEMFGAHPIRLFKYHPDSNSMIVFDHGLSRLADRQQLLADCAADNPATDVLAETRHKQDFGFCDSMAYDGDRYIYAGTVAGVLCRIDTQSGVVQKVSNVISSGRFPALAFQDSVLYGAGGMHGRTQLFRWDTRSSELESYDRLVDEASGENPARVHELAIGDGERIYLGENDNHQRSSYLWSVTLNRA